MVCILSTIQKINRKISIEDYLAGVDNSMAKILCSIYFTESQGYNISHNKLVQYNNSAILLEHNGKFSRSKCNKHIKNRYFFVKYVVAQDELEIYHCLTERIWNNILTNPHKFIAFKEFKEELMKRPVDYDDESTCEYVGNTTVVSDTNYLQTVKTNSRYRSYAEATRSTINPPWICRRSVLE